MGFFDGLDRTPKQKEEDSELFDINGSHAAFGISVEMEKYKEAHDFRQMRDSKIQDFATKYGYYPEKDKTNGHYR